MKPEPNFSTASPGFPQAMTAAPKTSGLAIASLVLGITSIIPTCLGAIIGVVLGIIAIVQISGSKGEFKGTGLAITGIILSVVLGLLAPVLLIMPAVLSVREAARKTADSNSVRQILLESHNYESRFRNLPPANNRTQGKGQGLSWRVHLLPLLGEQQLFDQFNLDEPWDSPTNIKLLPQMPKVFESVSSKAPVQEGHTLFLRPMGPSAIDGGMGANPRFSDVLDGTSNTIMIVMVDPFESVPWTQPDDYHFDPNDPTRGLSINNRGEYLFGFVDGSIHWIPSTTPPAAIYAMMTASDGEVIDWNQLGN